jgi:hypothetical protein
MNAISASSADEDGEAFGLPHFCYPFAAVLAPRLTPGGSVNMEKRDDIESKAAHHDDGGTHKVDAKAERKRAGKGGKIPPNQMHGFKNDPGRAYESTARTRGHRVGDRG